MLIVLTATGGFALFVFLFFVLVHPFICMIECALSKKHSGTSKVVWLAVTFLTGFLGALAYVIAGTHSQRLKRSSFQAVAIGAVCAAVCMGIAFAQPHTAEQAYALLTGQPETTQPEEQNPLGELASQLTSPEFANGDSKAAVAELQATMKQLQQSLSGSDGIELDADSIRQQFVDFAEGFANPQYTLSANGESLGNSVATVSPDADERSISAAAGEPSEANDATAEIASEAEFGRGQLVRLPTRLPVPEASAQHTPSDDAERRKPAAEQSRPSIAKSFTHPSIEPAISQPTQPTIADGPTGAPVVNRYRIGQTPILVPVDVGPVVNRYRIQN